MKYLDLTLPTAPENLACDEALLDSCEEEFSHEILRFWEPREYFVVVGYANHVAREVDRTACDAERVPVLRRCSGGGTVLQGPGCLNYSLILNIEENPPLQNITSANRFIMERNRAAMEALVRSADLQIGVSGEALDPRRSGDRRSVAISIEGHTDLAIGGRKFSGNAQRRRRRFLLFHGTFLLRFDLARIGRFLPLPSKQPAYRAGRAHRDFLTNLPAPAEAVKAALQHAWGAHDRLEIVPHDTITALARDKYATGGWSLKF